MTHPSTEPKPKPSAEELDFAVNLARRRNDPILEELWAVKAKINAEANYDLSRLIEMAQKAAAPFIGPDGRVRVPDVWPMPGVENDPMVAGAK